jgi:hypothetical protein
MAGLPVANASEVAASWWRSTPASDSPRCRVTRRNACAYTIAAFVPETAQCAHQRKRHRTGAHVPLIFGTSGWDRRYIAGGGWCGFLWGGGFVGGGGGGGGGGGAGGAATRRWRRAVAGV